MNRPFLLVLDDDPTGGQTVAQVPVVTAWERSDLSWLISRDAGMGFVLTNSRALSPDAAAETSATIVSRAVGEARRLGRSVRVLSRSDSTLRGHFKVELEAICRAWDRAGEPVDLILFAPAFFEAGRTTSDDVHYVDSEGGPQPVGESVYATDATFGFRESNLVAFASRRWPPCEASGASPLESPAISVTLEELRTGGVARLASRLAAISRIRSGGWPPVVVLNGTRAADYRAAADAVRRLDQGGLNVVSRCGPSWVAAMRGLAAPEPIVCVATSRCAVRNGLVVVGSHVSTTTVQLERLVDELDVPVVELDPELVTSGESAMHVIAVGERVAELLAESDVVLATRRQLLSHSDPGRSLELAAAVAESLDAAVRHAIRRTTPAWIVAKGGITSALMLRSALDLRRGWIIGQMFPGLLPVWSPELEDSQGSDPYDAHEKGEVTRPVCVIFPGNVGSQGLLVDVVQRLRGATDAAFRN